MGFLPGFTHRQKLEIVAPNAYSIDDYVHKFTVTFESGKMRDDFGDIRWTSDDGITELSYCIIEYTTGVSAIIYVKIGNIVAGVNHYVYRYSGDPTASTTSNGSDTFTLFDDFNDESIDETKWTASGDTVTEEADGYLLLNCVSNKNDRYLSSIQTFGKNYEICCRFLWWPNVEQDNLANYFGFGFWLNWHINSYGVRGYIDSWSEDFVTSSYNNDHEYGTLPSMDSFGEWYTGSVRRYEESSEFYINDVLQDTHTSIIPEGEFPVILGMKVGIYQRTGYGKYDFVFVRPISPDPEDEPDDGTVYDWEEISQDDVRIKVGVVPIEDVADEDGNLHSVLASMVQRRFASDSIIHDVNLILEGNINGFDQGAPYYKEAAVNGGSALGTLETVKLILLINTGRTYRDALTTGVKANRSIKISCAGALLSILNPGEPFYMKDNNGSIDATDFVIETVNTDGTTIGSGSGLAAKCLILQ